MNVKRRKIGVRQMNDVWTTLRQGVRKFREFHSLKAYRRSKYGELRLGESRKRGDRETERRQRKRFGVG